MPEKLEEKIHAALYKISPLASDREIIIEEIGKTVWVETLDKALETLEEPSRSEVVVLIKEGSIDKAIDRIVDADVDLEAIIKEVSGSVMDELLADK
jgi:3-methyladenine DNA glycosylase/8-oxoguanine DNA glycosylase